jgi:preprotein translocase subunit SecG
MMKDFFIVITLIGFALFLILLVLVQRGRGGGLAGALGGAGGQSAFGAKAGDTFTKITMWTAFFWIVFCVFAVRIMTGSSEPDFSDTLRGSRSETTELGGAAPVAETGTDNGPAATSSADESATTPPATDEAKGKKAEPTEPTEEPTQK